jgi:hypothetical protein
MAGLHNLRARLSVLAARVPVPPAAWPLVEFDLVESGAAGRPVTTGRLIHDANTPTGWREIPPDTETQNERIHT